MESKVKSWIFSIRAPFLFLSLDLALLGTALAFHEKTLSIFMAILGAAGLILLHIAVNLLNEYHDFVTGLDLTTIKTPFSGGSGVLAQGNLSACAALMGALACLGVATILGIYFTLSSGIGLIPLLVIGLVIIVTYTPFLTHHLLGEVSAGLGLGLLPVMGIFYIQSSHYSISSILTGLIAGLLTFNLLLLNEYPDMEPDLKVGRFNLIHCFGPDKAAKIYTFIGFSVYILIIIYVIVGIFRPWILLSLLTIPLLLKSVKWVMGSRDKSSMIPALASNVMMVLGTQFLMAIGIIISAL